MRRHGARRGRRPVIDLNPRSIEHRSTHDDPRAHQQVSVAHRRLPALLVDASGTPTFLHADTAWSLIVGTDRAGVTRYLDDRSARGFNAVVINLIERLFAPSAPRNVFGDAPFHDPGRIREPNEAYFAHAAWVIGEAARRGLAVLLAPAYLGYARPHFPGTTAPRRAGTTRCLRRASTTAPNTDGMSLGGWRTTGTSSG